MAQTLTEDNLTASTSREFSDLAWRFNNLNSAAKMLLVGTSSTSVPFIPISELVYDSNNQSTASNSNLSLSSLSSPSVPASSPATSIFASTPTVATSWDIKPALTNFPATSTEAKTAGRELEAPIVASAPAFKPAFYERTAETPIAPVESSFSMLAPTPVELPLNKPSFTVQTQESSDHLTPVIEPETRNEESYAPQITHEEHNELFEPNAYDAARAWSYHNDEVIETHQERKGTFWGPFIRGTAKSAAVITTIALLGFGTFYLLKAFNKNQDDSLNDLDTIDKEISESSSSVSNTESSTESTISSASPLKDKTFFEEKESIKSMPSAPPKAATADRKLASQSDDTYYKPYVSPIKKTIKTTKPKVYVSPSKFNSYSSKFSKPPAPSTNPTYTYTQTQPTQTQPTQIPTENPTQFLFDPTTVYDSSASAAIKPETYTAERFPIEISYTKPSAQYEAATLAPAINQASAPLAEPAEQTNAQEVAPTATQFAPTSTPTQQPIYSVPNVQNVKPSNEDSDLNAAPVGAASQNSSFNAPSQPVYTQPLTHEIPVEDDFAPSMKQAPQSYQPEEAEEENGPILRKPVQSSSNNETYASPYKNSQAPMTSNMVVQDRSRFAPVSKSYTKTPASAPKRKFFGRFSKQYRQEAATKNANTALNSYQNRLQEIQTKANSNALTETERQKLVREVESLQRSIAQTQKELQQKNAGGNVLSNNAQQLKRTEEEANKVYLKPSNMPEEQELNDEESSLNISYL
jgi:hypothetical protein